VEAVGTSPCPALVIAFIHRESYPHPTQPALALSPTIPLYMNLASAPHHTCSLSPSLTFTNGDPVIDHHQHSCKQSSIREAIQDTSTSSHTKHSLVDDEFQKDAPSTTCWKGTTGIPDQSHLKKFK
jgi:hypothetical protein